MSPLYIAPRHQPYISADRGPASNGASHAQRVQVTCHDGSTLEAHAKFAEAVENGVRGLASEFLASRLARLIDADIPEALVVELPATLTLTLSNAVTAAPGLAVASRTIEHAVDVTGPEALNGISRAKLALLATVESWTQVGDRGHNLLRAGGRAYAIDFASAFDAIWTGSPAAPTLVEDGLLRDHLADDFASVNAAADRLEEVEDDAIDAAIEGVPDAWMSEDARARFRVALKTNRDTIAAELRAKYKLL